MNKDMKLIKEENGYKVYRSTKSGIAVVIDPSSGTHSAHPNIHRTGSVRGMKNMGYWRKADRVVLTNGYKYNIDLVSVSSFLDMVAKNHCLCAACEKGSEDDGFQTGAVAALIGKLADFGLEPARPLGWTDEYVDFFKVTGWWPDLSDDDDGLPAPVGVGYKLTLEMDWESSSNNVRFVAEVMAVYSTVVDDYETDFDPSCLPKGEYEAALNQLKEAVRFVMENGVERGRMEEVQMGG